MSFDAFDVVVVPFPFTDKGGSRRRPALVVSTGDFNRRHDQVVLAMVTTAQSSDWASDVMLERWAEAGLSTGCRVRLKLFTLDRDLIVRRIGNLAGRDREATRSALAAALAVT